ncbi:MAG TPA: MauE/DoxX family redox-associated membrane protein, partial [Bacteroidia bacterium]|nr:MauE/DoxX family redox-associated membrane protein [Bacteroidia bacterium]
YIGYHSFLIAFSGVCEILLGLLLIPKATRKIAAWLITLMLIVFLWIHVQMLIDFWKNNDKDLWIAIVRLPLQFLLIWWAYTFTKTSPERT